MSDFSYQHLTPSIILDAIEDLGILVTSGLLALNSYENRVYQFTTESHGRMVVKFYRPERWTNEQIEEEHQFAFELQDHELPIVAPLKFNGQSVHQFQTYRFALYPSVGGREFEVDNLDQLEWVGRFLGRIHAISSTSSFHYRNEINIQRFLAEPRIELENSRLLPEHLKTAFFSIFDHLVEATTTQFDQNITNTSLIRLHGDCHPGNILWRDGPSFVDLDDCLTGPAIQDLWMMLSGDTMQQRIQLETIVEAYEEFMPFNNKELALIEPLRAMRLIHYMAWLSRRWSDPAFPRAFPWFADDKYWEGQILALKEQMSSMQEPPLRLGY